MKEKTTFLFTRKLRLPLLLLLLLGLGEVSWSQAQVPSVSGTVSDSEGAPLIGVTITADNESSDLVQSVPSDINGKFTFPSLPAGQYSFTFEYLGFKTETRSGLSITAGQTLSLNIGMQEDASLLDEVVVVGYGTQKKVNLTGAITTVDITEKENQPITNVSNAMYGTSGLFVNLGNSMPGVDRATIRIRGIGTLNDNNPLVLVNGIEYPMDELDPNDIASITVLKDASAAIYGSRAANGVLLVTTKSAKNKSQVNYSFYTGIQQPTTMPDVIWDPVAYMKLKNQAVLNSGKSKPEYPDEEVAAYEQGVGTDPYLYPASDWFDIALENGIIQKHNLSFSGGSESIRYRLSLGFLDRNGIVIGPNNDEQKYSLGFNSSADVSEKLTVGLTFNGYYRNYNQPVYSNGDYWKGLMRALPILPDTLANGMYGVPTIRTSGRNNYEHPRMLAEQGNYKKYIQRFLATIYADYQLPFNINYNIKFGVDKYDGFQERFVPQMVKQRNTNDEDGNPVIQRWNNPATAPRAYRNDYNDLNLHLYNTLDWNKEFNGVHNLGVMLGMSYDHFGSRGFDAQTAGYMDATLTALHVGDDRRSIGGGSYSEDVLISYFGRLNYDFKDKYLLEAIFRYDGSSRFAPGNRWGFFPGVSAGWRLDKESFLADNDLIDLLKIRASIGRLGNQAVPLYSYENTVEVGENYNFGGQLITGAATNDYVDPSIHWETTTTYNAGVDLSLFKNRLSFTGDVYKRRTTDILRTVNLPAQVGNLAGPKRNVGTVDNTGFELSLGYRNRIKDFTYDVSGTFSYNKNRVVDLGGQILYGDGTNLSTVTREGAIINAYYILDAIGIFQTEEEIEAHADQGSNTIPGYVKYRDVNGDGTINGEDRVEFDYSSITPKFTYGFGFNLGYKGFSLSANLQGIAGIKIYPTSNIAFPFNNGAGATWEWATDAWTPENTDARLPIVTESTSQDDNFEPSDFWLRDGSYLRLRNVQLAYSLPKSWLNKIGVGKVQVFVNGQNLLTFSKYDDFDVESIVNASSLYHYPMLKTYSGGINVTF